MALFCAAIRRNSVSLLHFHFLSHVHIFPSEMSFVSRLKCPWSCSSSYFGFLVFVVPLVFESLVLFLVTVISLSPRFCMLSSSRCIDVFTLSLMLVRPLPPSFLDTYNLSTLSLRCTVLCMVISFLVLWSIWLSSSLPHFKNGPKYLTSRTVQVFIPLTRFLP